MYIRGTSEKKVTTSSRLISQPVTSQSLCPSRRAIWLPARVPACMQPPILLCLSKRLRAVLKRPIRTFRSSCIRTRNSLTLPRIILLFQAKLILFFNSSNQNIDISSILTQPHNRATHWNIRGSSTFPSEESDDMDHWGKGEENWRGCITKSCFCIFSCEQCHWIC